MPGVVRKGLDKHIGHAAPKQPFHQTSYDQGSNNVYVNGQPVVRVDDKTTCGDFASTGSSNVYINGKRVHREGDKTSGHGPWVSNAAASGSKNVFANG